MRYSKQRALEEAEMVIRLDQPGATVLVMGASFNAAKKQLHGARPDLMECIDPPDPV
ncbi:hypothetical protein [Kocuria sp. CH-021]|uniref:hypothetical protein n=1 Tax=Kocuria sp. CH-021 TaxID=3406735 RepID=UPI003C7593F5